jgi:hypothetical protein
MMAIIPRPELDLLVLAKGKRWGFEVKYQDAPTITKSMRIARQDFSVYSLICGAPLISSTITVAWGSGAVAGTEIVVPLRDSTFKRADDLPIM